jgi:MFS family permease
LGEKKMDFNLLKNKNFSLYIIGRSISIMGDRFLTIALALYILSTTGSAAKYATVIALGFVPLLVLGPIAGSIVDRIDRKKMIICLDLLRGVLLTGMFLISFIKPIGEVEIYIMSVIFGACESFYSPTDRTIIPSLLEQKNFVQGNLLSQTFIQTSSVIAPALAALVYTIVGMGSIFIIDAASFFIIGIAISFIKLKPMSVHAKQKGILSNVIDGFKLYKDKEILSISLNGMLTHLLVLPIFLVGFPYLIMKMFNGSNMNYGTVQTVYSIGTLCAFLTVPIVSKYYKELKALNIGMYGMLASIAILFLILFTPFSQALKNNHIAMIIFFCVIGFIFSLSFSTYGVFYNSFNQKKINNQFLGRFYSMLVMLIAIGTIFGNKIYGALFDMNMIFFPLILAFVGIILKLFLNLLVTSVPAPENKPLNINIEKNISVKEEN